MNKKLKSPLKTYYWLIKPGIIYGNTITAAAGFLLSSKGDIDLVPFLNTLLGIALVMASGCVYNNYLDRNIDKHMARTKKRALVSGKVSPRAALIFATILAAGGFTVLSEFTNTLTVVLGVLALFVYVVLYGYAKRQSAIGTVVGSIAGALPPVAGYTAATGVFDTGAAIIGMVLVFWQMPHFYAIAMYRLDEYKAAGVPVLPLKEGARVTKINILMYVVAFIFATSLLTVYGYTGYVYLVVMGIAGAWWLWRGLHGFKTADDKRWARMMFRTSLIVLMTFSVMISVDSVLR